jgi:hypothetical protein
MDMDYTDAVRAVTTSLAAGGDDFAAAAAISLPWGAWRHLGSTDPVWDRVGLELLDVRGRALPRPGRECRGGRPRRGSADAGRGGRIARAAGSPPPAAGRGDAPLAEQLAHDADVQQLRDAAAALA